MKDLLITLMIVVIVVIFFSEAAFLAAAVSAPSNLEPGDPVVVLTGKTVIVDGAACPESRPGFIAYTNPEGGLNWYRPNRVLFPYQEIAVVYPDGTVWVNYSYIQKPGSVYKPCQLP